MCWTPQSVSVQFWLVYPMIIKHGNGNPAFSLGWWITITGPPEHLTQTWCLGPPKVAGKIQTSNHYIYIYKSFIQFYSHVSYFSGRFSKFKQFLGYVWGKARCYWTRVSGRFPEPIHWPKLCPDRFHRFLGFAEGVHRKSNTYFLENSYFFWVFPLDFP